MSAIWYLNPLWILYALTLRLPIKMVVWFFKKLFNFPLTAVRIVKREWNRFDNPLLKLIWTGQFIWWAMPATIPMTFYWSLPYLQKIATFFGYGEEFSVIVSWVEFIAGVLWYVIKAAWHAGVAAWNFATM